MKKKLISLALIGAIISSITSLTAYAFDYSKNYDTTSMTWVAAIGNNASYTRTLGCNTNPSSGQSGAYVEIRKSNGTVTASKTFPFYSSTTDLTDSVPSGEIRNFYVGSAGSSRVTGILYFGFYP